MPRDAEEQRRSLRLLTEAKALLQQGLRGAQDLVFPHHALDGSGHTMTTGLPAEAWSKIHFIDDPVCGGCGAPYAYDTGSRCAACLAQPRAFNRARAACLYDDASRDLILQFKHADRTDLAPLFVRWLSRAGADILESADAIAPVPLHRGRLLKRKYNQAAEIARPLARQAGLTYLPDALIRRRATDSQGGKSGSGRRRNVAGAFEVPRAQHVADKTIVLIDDVLTTGATAEACARALLKAGAKSVDLLVLARVKDAANVSI
jgi:ComF family protein